MSYKHTVRETIGGNPFSKKTGTDDPPVSAKPPAPAPPPKESDNAVWARAIKKS